MFYNGPITAKNMRINLDRLVDEGRAETRPVSGMGRATAIFRPSKTGSNSDFSSSGDAERETTDLFLE